MEWKKDKKFNAFARLKESYCIVINYGGYLIMDVEGFDKPMNVKINNLLLHNLSGGSIAGQFRMVGNKLGRNGRPKMSPLFLAYERPEVYL